MLKVRQDKLDQKVIDHLIFKCGLNGQEVFVFAQGSLCKSALLAFIRRNTRAET